MNILKGEATFSLPGRPGPARSHAARGAALMVLADTSARGRFFFGAQQNREGKLLSHFLFPGARG